MENERLPIDLSTHSSLGSLLNYWATLEGRSISELTFSLLEQAINEAKDKNRIPSIVLKLVEDEMKLREKYLLRSFRSKIKSIEDKLKEQYSEAYLSSKDSNNKIDVSIMSNDFINENNNERKYLRSSMINPSLEKRSNKEDLKPKRLTDQEYFEQKKAYDKELAKDFLKGQKSKNKNEQ